MFTQLVKTPLTLARYRNGPFAREREQYLTHLSQRGYGKGRLTGINIQLLAIAQRLPIGVHKRVTKAEVSEAAEIWTKERRRRSSLPHSLVLAKTDFISIACNWLRFLGWIDETRPTLPFVNQLDEFLIHLRDDRGLSEATIIRLHYAACPRYAGPLDITRTTTLHVIPLIRSTLTNYKRLSP